MSEATTTTTERAPSVYVPSAEALATVLAPGARPPGRARWARR